MMGANEVDTAQLECWVSSLCEALKESSADAYVGVRSDDWPTLIDGSFDLRSVAMKMASAGYAIQRDKPPE